MKTIKLSLAAVMATSMLSSLSATPLEEAIKDIDVSGFGRYRYEANNYKYTSEDANEGVYGENKINHNFHRFTLDVNFKATLDDNFFAYIGVRYDTIDISGAGSRDLGTNVYRGISNTHGGLAGVNGSFYPGWGGAGADNLSIREYYVGYTGIPDTTILAGRQVVNSFFTDDIVGTGIKLINTSIDGLTITAYAFDNLEDDEDVSDFSPVKSDALIGWWDGREVYTRDVMPGLDSMPHQNNLYGIALNGVYGWFSFGLELAHLANVTTLWAVDLGANYDISDDFSLRARANVAGTHFTSSFKNKLTYYPGKSSDPEDPNYTFVKNSTFWGLEAGFSAYGFDFDAGYVQYGKKKATTLFTVEDTGKFIKAGETLMKIMPYGKNKAWFAKAKYTYDAFSLGLEYLHLKQLSGGKETAYLYDPDTRSHEWVIRAGYKYNDKLSFDAWYSMAKVTYKDMLINGAYRDVSDKMNRFRFDAVYNF